jgi:2,4-dienoyl-CoA reductase-like NADH-dependent reductase (Old Yellow Enzyme family)/thioredoxin reductase
MSSTRFPRLLSPLRLGSLELPNRIIFGPHATGLEADPEAYGAYLAARANGGARMIITSLVSVHPSGHLGTHYLKLHDDSDLKLMQGLLNAAKGRGAELFLQMGHLGRGAGIFNADGTRKIPLSPTTSRVTFPAGNVIAQQISLDQIDAIVRAHATAAIRAREAGANGIELYASHDSLPASFLAERVNKRADHYGGTIENRFRFLKDIIGAIRTAVGREYPLGMRISGDDCDNSGLSPEESLQFCKQIDQLGTVDYLHIVQGAEASRRGLLAAIPSMFDRDGSGAAFSRPIKASVQMPVIANGRINQPQIAEDILARGDADGVCLVRPLICDAQYVNKVSRGAQEEIRACIACNQACIGHAMHGASISCIQSPETGRELLFRGRIASRGKRRVLVVGGGPAGMRAAVEAAGRGHAVQLCEAGTQLGGQVLVAQLIPGREEFGGAATNLMAELARIDVEVKLNTRVDAAYVERYAPDLVIVATGAIPFLPEIDDGEGMQRVSAWSVLRGQSVVGSRVIVVDEIGDWVAPGVAETLVTKGYNVTVTTIHARICEAVLFDGDIAAGRLFDRGVNVIPYAKLFGSVDRTAIFEHVIALRPIELTNVDSLVVCAGMTSERSLTGQISHLKAEVRVVGDAMSPRTAEEAIFEGFVAGRES